MTERDGVFTPSQGLEDGTLPGNETDFRSATGYPPRRKVWKTALQEQKIPE